MLYAALSARNSEFLERARLTDRCRRIESYHFRRKSRIIRPAFCQTDIPFVHFYKGRVLLQQLRTPTTTKRPLRFRSFTNSDVFLVIQIFPICGFLSDSHITSDLRTPSQFSPWFKIRYKSSVVDPSSTRPRLLLC